MKHRYFLSAIFFFSINILILSGCASLRPSTDPLLDQKAVILSNQTRSINQHILASKGTGWARLETQTKADTFKIAWAAVFPNKIRITFLLSGHPVETILATGETVTFLSHTGAHSKYSYNSKDPDMTDYIKVPVRMSELILVLLGRFPLKKFDDAYFSPLDPSLSTIILKQKWKATKQSLHFNTDKKVDALQTIDNKGTLLHEMKILGYQTQASSTIPVRIELIDKDAGTLFLDIINFQPNPPIKDAVFRLTEPG